MIRVLANRIAQDYLKLSKRLDPYVRDAFDDTLKAPLSNLTQDVIRTLYQAKQLARHEPALELAEEKPLPDEEALIQAITDKMNRFLQREYQETGRIAERAGNTKTYGLVKARFEIHNTLPKGYRVGLFRETHSYPAYVRFAGPGPRVTPDIDNNGILSMGVKLMEVPGNKLMADETNTLDWLGISCPTFTTPDIRANSVLQKEIGRGTPAWYFLNPLDPHWLDAIMQGLYARAHANPLELRYFSCVPYLWGRRKAMKFAFTPLSEIRSSVGEVTPDYLREAMIETLSESEVAFDVGVQLQTDPKRMPIEDASVEWSEKESPFVSVATLRIPKQTFDSEKQLTFARKLTFNPWHTIASHRPLGNQNRARKVVYQKTAQMRQAINGEAHVEPTGRERFA